MGHREINGRRHNKSGKDKKTRKSQHLKIDKNGGFFTGSKSLLKRHEKKNRRDNSKVLMNKAALNENLGNVVLVKNTKSGDIYKEQQTVTSSSQLPLRPQHQPCKSADVYLQASTQPEVHTKDTASPNKIKPICEESANRVPSIASQEKDFKYDKQPQLANKSQFCFVKNMKTLPNTTKKHSRNEANEIYPVRDDALKEEAKETRDDITRNEKSDEVAARNDKLTKWHKYVEEVVEAGTEGIQNTFRSVRSHLPPAATRRGFDLNMEKNRFEDIICIDQTRVRLQGNEYIHASWVNINKDRKAILTQLPMQHTAAAFWRMILDNDVQAILLILTHFEYQTFCASAVFPGQQDFLGFEEAHICIAEFKRVTITKNWTLHIISVRNGDKKRFVHVHHYSGWVHGKEPHEILELWQIQSTFRNYSHPHVYVSLSGCGRAGTYAVFEMAHDRLHSDNFSSLSVTDCITSVRSERMHSLQRLNQLYTVHLALLEHIMSNRSQLNISQKHFDKYEELNRTLVQTPSRKTNSKNNSYTN